MTGKRVGWFVAVSALALVALHCSSFGAGEAGGAVDGGAGDAGGTGDTGSPTTSSCASAQAVDGGHLFCADFEDGRTEAWRGARREALWMEEGDSGTSLAIGPEGRASPNALLVTSGDETSPSDTFSRGWLAYDIRQVDGVRVELDMRVEQQASVSGLGVYLSVLKLETEDADFELRIMAGNAALTRVGIETTRFADGFPPLFQNWRHVVVDIFREAGTHSIRVEVDGEIAVEQDVDGRFPAFPTAVKLLVGAPVYNGGPFGVRVDNITVDAHR